MVSEKQNNFEATLICWAVAAFAGFISMILLYAFAEFSALQAVFTGGLIGFVLGVILTLFLSRRQTSAADLASNEKPAQRYARQAAEDMARRRAASAPATPAPAAETAAPAAAAVSSTPAEASSAPVTTPSGFAGVKPSQPLAGEAELSARKGSWKYEKDAEEDPKKGAIAAGETAAPAVAPTQAAEAAAKPVAADGKPELYTAPPAEGADDLKLISGVGPKLEQTLNDMGIYRFEQVAGWRKQEIDWVDQRLRFKGRIERDDWMAQAKILAAGGETEFSRKKKK